MENTGDKINKLESEDFYNLMQEYRNAQIEDQTEVIEKFNNVKEWIKTNLI